MVWNIVALIQAEIKHEGRTGKRAFLKPGSRPASAELLRDDAGHRFPEISVQDHEIGIGFNAAFQPYPRSPAVPDQYPGHAGTEAYPPAVLLENLSHRFGQLMYAPHGMVDAVCMLDVRQDGKRPRTVPGRHAEILGLEGHGDAHVFMLEEPGQNPVKAFGHVHERQGFKQFRIEVAVPA